VSGEAEDLWPIFRIPVGGARVTPESESRFLYGPPLPNPQVSAAPGGREVVVTTFDRERRVGVVYLIRDGLAEFLAGGTPVRGLPALLKQPEGVASDAAGHVYVADRDRGVVVKLDGTGRVIDPSWVTVSRPRLLAFDSQGYLWVGGDGSAEAPWQRGTGEIWRVSPEGRPALVLRGPMPTGFALGPGGHLYVADRQGARIFVVTADGRTTPFATFTDNDAPRALGFAPVTPQTRRAGVAGDMFLITINRGAWPVNQVLRVTGPFEQLAGER
jgi:DNA-binding beta-propeller fold protein YncE